MSFFLQQLILVWTPGKGSPIHDHGNAHCVMKILHGDLTETRYDFPDGDEAKPMEVKSEAVHSKNQVAYMADELGLHRVSNQGTDYAVSLHRKLCSLMSSVEMIVLSSVDPFADFVDSVHTPKRGQKWLPHLQQLDGIENPRRQVWVLLCVWREGGSELMISCRFIDLLSVYMASQAVIFRMPFSCCFDLIDGCWARCRCLVESPSVGRSGFGV